MARVRTLKDLENFQWTGSDLVHSLTSGAHLFLFAYSPDVQALISWSSNAAQILGLPDTTIMRDGNLFLRHVHPDDRFMLMTDLEQALKGRTEYRATYRWIRPDSNEVRWLHCRATLVKRDEQNVFEGVIIDLSDEITGPISRVAGPDSLATILDAFSTTVIVLDKELRLIRVNRRIESSHFNFGDPEFDSSLFKMGKPFLTCIKDQDQQQRLKKAFNQVLSGEEYSFKSRISEEQAVFQLTVTPVTERDFINGVLITVSDVSEIVNLEQQLAELQKTEGLRLIAAGVSHNFNNALQSIIGHAAVIHNHPTNQELIKESSQAIIDTVNKTSELSKQLYRLDSSISDGVSAIELNLAVMAAVNKIDNLFASGAKVTVVFGSPPAVLGRQEDLAEAIEAILRNARESLDESGSISIKTEERTLSEFEVQDLRQGEYAKLIISDTGPGMSAESVKKCLDPFYTTIGTDPGTGVGLVRHGLGLSAAFSIIRKFKGGITIDSAIGSGTTICIFLPVARLQPAPEAQEVKPQTLTLSQHPEVLLIDDDRVVVETVTAILKDLGIRSVAAEDGKSGLALLRKHQRSLKAILLDAIMPGVSGATLVKRLKRISKNTPIIGFTGAPPEVTEPMLAAGAEKILRKPVGAKQLKEALSGSFKNQQAA